MKQMIDVADLRIGMYIVDVDRPWLDTPFLFQGFPIETQKDIDWVQRTCHFVYIDADQSATVKLKEAPKVLPARHSETEKAIQHLRRKSQPPKQVSFIEEFKPARAIRSQAKTYLKNVFNDIRQGKGIDIKAAEKVVSAMVESISRNPDASLWFTQLRKKDEYTANHSLNVCVLTLAFAHHLNFKESILHDLGVGALLHDIGKMRIPLNVLNKPGPLTADELALVKMHPTYGAEILQETAGISPTAVDIAHCHHERVDGKGYPRGLTAEEIGLFSKMVAVVDVYDAITSNRVYHHGMSPSDALRNMYAWQHKDFDESLVEDFIQCLGIYPVGSVVQLNTGDIGIIMNDNKEHRLRPTVKVVLDDKQEPLFPSRIINLQDYDGSDGSMNYFIKKTFGPDECPFDIAEHIVADLPDTQIA